MLDILKLISTIPTALNGFVAGRASLKADVQTRNDIRYYMRSGLMTVQKILDSASDKQKLAAEEEYRLYKLPKNDPRRCKKFSVRGKIPAKNAAKLFQVTKDVEAILSIATVFLSKELRRKLTSLRTLLQTCEFDYEDDDNYFRFARCHRLEEKMNEIIKEARVSSPTQKIAGKI